MELTLATADGRIVCPHCRIADNPFIRARGLLGRSRLDPDEGLLIATGAIHTWFMRFPIDVVFLDRENVVRDIVEMLKPWRIVIRRKATSVVELPAGASAARGIRIGDKLMFHEPGQAGNGAAADGRLRVGIVSGDARFLRVAGFLLGRQGFDVKTCRRLDRATSLGPRDVLLVDGSGSLSSAARFVRLLAVDEPSTAVVVVADGMNGSGGDAMPKSLRVVPKWESFDEIIEAIATAAPEKAVARA